MAVESSVPPLLALCALLVGCGPDRECRKGLYVEGDMDCATVERRVAIARAAVIEHVVADPEAFDKVIAPLPIFIHAAEMLPDPDKPLEGITEPCTTAGQYSLRYDEIHVGVTMVATAHEMLHGWEELRLGLSRRDIDAHLPERWHRNPGGYYTCSIHYQHSLTTEEAQP